MIGGGFLVVWMVVAFLVLRSIARRVFAESRRAEIAAGAVVLAFASGAIWPFSQQQRPLAAPDGSSPTAEGGASAAGPIPGSGSERKVSSRCPDVVALVAGGFGSVDIVHAMGDATPINDGGAVSSDAALVIQGWAASVSRNRVASAVCLVLDDRVDGSAVVTYGGARPDVATAFHSPQIAASGFQIVLPGHAVSAGNHNLQVVVESEGRGFNVIPGARTITFR